MKFKCEIVDALHMRLHQACCYCPLAIKAVCVCVNNPRRIWLASHHHRHTHRKRERDIQQSVVRTASLTRWFSRFELDSQHVNEFKEEGERIKNNLNRTKSKQKRERYLVPVTKCCFDYRTQYCLN